MWLSLSFDRAFDRVILSEAVFQAEGRIVSGQPKALAHARFLAPLVKARRFGMTP
jgi:hypothetical protein